MQPYEQQVATLYDRLLGYEQQTDDALTVHKRLRFPDAWQSAGIHDVNDWLKHNLTISAETRVLDAGCGVGGTLFALLQERGTGVGITLSGRQLTVAETAAQRLSLQERVHFLQQSYDDPLESQFDIVITVEALAHSADLTQSIANLATALRPKGQLVIVEEMWVGDQSSGWARDLLQASWRLAHVHRQGAYEAALNSAELTRLAEHDFTPFVQAKRWPRPLLLAAHHLLCWLPTKQRNVLQIYLGGLALETLYAMGQMQYKVWIVGQSGGRKVSEHRSIARCQRPEP